MDRVIPKIISPKLHYSDIFPLNIRIFLRRTPFGNGLHCHDCTELWYLLSGKAVQRINDKTFIQTPGTCVTVPPFVLHDLDTSVSSDTPLFVQINIYDHYIRRCGHDFCSYCDGKVYFNGAFLPVFQKFSSQKMDIASGLMHKISDEFNLDATIDFDKILSLFVSFLELLEGDKSTLRLTPSMLNRINSILDAAVYLDKHYSENITIDHLCRISNMSKSRFSEYFKQITGVSAMYYLKCLRLIKARKLFLLRGKDLASAARETGFYDTAHLCHAFKEHSGETLSEQKRNIQVKEQLIDREIRPYYSKLRKHREISKSQEQGT